MLLLLSQPWGVSKCAPRNIACTGIWKVPALRGIKVCTGEHCVHWMINRAPTLPPPRVPSPSPQGPHPTNYETQSQSQSQFWTWTWNQIQIHPRVPNLPPRVPTLPFPPGSPPYQLWNSTQYANSKPISILPTRVPTLPNLNFKLKKQTQNSNSNFKLNPKLTF